ncbi:GOLPH3/VPS74 family protein [Arthrobacter sp. R4]|uniref:GOLPH3/VPS74 family protein n=1 Tax=Arthrobacter sp. R4 TaxID=644417 RepID=UPI003ED882A0
MNAETSKASELNLPQAFLLLATNDTTGKPDIPVFALRTTLAGAILAELDLIDAIELQGKHVKATGTSPKTDLQHELELIRGKSRPHTPKRWVSMLEGRAEVQRIYEGMASRGIVEHVGERHLGLFRAVRYPEKDHAPEAALLERIRAALNGPPSNLEVPDTSTDAGTAAAGTADAGTSDAGPADARMADAGTAEAAATESTKPGDGTPGAKPGSEAPDARTTALIALLQASGLLVKLFPEADLTRANELSWDYWPTRAVEDELRMIRIAEQEAANL